MADDWKRTAIRALIGYRKRAWSYGLELKPCVEPTALAILGLLAATDGAKSPELSAAVRSAGDWLASLQQANGSLGISEASPEPRWATPYAVLAWNALGGYEKERRLAVNWLLRESGGIVAEEKGHRPVQGHDSSIVGWPWTSGTHSWVEPTALALLALRREGLGSSARVQEGLRLLRDRAIESGGWNFGNKSTYGRVLRAYPATTGLALLALANTGPCGDLAKDGARYLLETLPRVRAAGSLGWGLLGLRAWGRSPEEADRWLARSVVNLAGRPDAAPRLAVLLLAAGEKSLELFNAA